MTWSVFIEDGEKHVVPDDDKREHVLASQECWCRPFLDDDIIVHNSLDGREDHESGGVHPKSRPPN